MVVEIKIISLKNPCSTCYMKYSYILQIIYSLKKKYPFIEVKDIVYESELEASQLQSLKIKIFPSVIVNDIQFSAGIIPNKKELEKHIQSIIG